MALPDEEGKTGSDLLNSGRVDNSKISATPKLRGSNAELYEVKIYGPKGELQFTISQGAVYNREKLMKDN